MSSISESIGRLIASARKLRELADELGNVDLKSQIIDEISNLQEIRDELSEEGGSHVLSSTDLASMVKAAGEVKQEEPTPAPAPEGSSQLKLREERFAVIAPSDDGETYGIGADAEDDDSEVEETSQDDGASESDGGADDGDEGESETDGIADSAVDVPVADRNEKSGTVSQPEKNPGKPKPSLSPEQRAMAEMRIADLEPLERDAQRRLETVLSPEQRQIKTQATKAGRDAGKTGRDLQLYVHKAMKTTPEQRHQISAARKDLQTIREAIEKEREILEPDDGADDA